MTNRIGATSGNPLRNNRTMSAVVASVTNGLPGREVLFIALEDPGGPAIGHASNVRCVGHQATARDVARFHQAADVYLHATRADTFPTAVLEALACGTPVVASHVGGLPEQVISATTERVRAGEIGDASGVLVAAGDATSMAGAVIALLEQPSVRERMGSNASGDARRRFDEQRQVDDYLAWYREVCADWKARREPRAS